VKKILAGTYNSSSPFLVQMDAKVKLTVCVINR